MKLDLARQGAARQALGNTEFRELNVYEWAETSSDDLVYCRNLLQHLGRPVDVLRSMWAAGPGAPDQDSMLGVVSLSMSASSRVIAIPCRSVSMVKLACT